MFRDELNFLTTWNASPYRKPLLIRGARQVGKSTLVREFCRSNNISLLEINFEKRKLTSLKQENLLVQNILQEVEIICGLKIDPKTSLIFFDEIQDEPRAITALRYFFEERPEIKIIAAGSLLEFIFMNKEVDIPVGRIDFLPLGPMTFSEFLLACGEYQLVDILQTPEKIQAHHHELLKEKLKYFYFVGGMPEAIKVFAESKSLLEVRRIQKSIIETYQEDFYKYSKSQQIERVHKVFHYVPRRLGEKVKYREIDADKKSREIKKAIELLIWAKVVLPVYHSNSNQLPLESQMDTSIFKLYFLDIGLALFLKGVQWENINNNHLEDGKHIEQFIAQHLLYQKDITQRNLFYWLRDKKKRNAEVDFVTAFKQMVVPIEVKNEKSENIKSLYVFAAEKKTEIALVFCSDPPSFKNIINKISFLDKTLDVHLKLIKCPHYLVEFWRKLLTSLS